MGLAVQPAAATSTSAQTADNGTTMDVQFDRDAIHVGDGTGVQAHMEVDNVSSGAEVEITAAGLSEGALAAMIDGDMTANGVRTTVPANGTIPVHGPPSCTTGDFEFTVQRSDTGATATAPLTLTILGDLDVQFERANYSGTPGSVVPVTIDAECADLRVGIADPDSDYQVSVAIDDDDRNHTLWIDTAEPMNASQLFTAEIDANTSGYRRSGTLTKLNGTYRLFVGSSPRTPFTANLTVTPNGTPRPTAEDALSVEVYSDLFVTNDDSQSRPFPFGLRDLNSNVPVTAHLRNATADIPSATFAAMVSNGSIREDPRVHRFENGTVPLFIPAGMRCRTGELTVAFQRLDTGATAMAETTAAANAAVGGSLHRRNYTVESGSVLPVTLTRECHDLTLELTRTDSEATASIELGTNRSVERNETVWFDTGRAGTASGLFRSEVGTPTRNTTTDFSDGALPLGIYSLRTIYNDHEIDTATLTVTNESADGPPSDSTDGSSGITTPTPNTIVPPPTETSTTEHTTADRPTTDPPTTGPLPTVAITDSATAVATSSETAGTGPGFGPGLALVALAAVIVLALRGPER
ncbi:hypothetical protein [Halorientalis persicus]|uniref:hypothetical protein n=1 Tax=Halorientalis persicus TaxID=1367881 RepID=UPI0011133347|nr:hypothetical protein [Halorientalis persicus]